MDPIGGYFGLELRNGDHYHKEAIKLNTAKNCFEYILKARGYRKVYIPHYTCDVMLQPLNKCRVDYEYYHINESLEPVCNISLNNNEAFLYTNYFGLKQDCVTRLSSQYGNRLIVDNAQAFFAKPIDGIDTFYSARKFFGVPDGAYLYTDCILNDEFEQDISYERMSHLLMRVDIGAEIGFPNFRNNDTSLANIPIRSMSNLTRMILKSIDYEYCKKKRIDNFYYLDKYLYPTNNIHMKLREYDVPMIYPYMTNDNSLRDKLIKNKIFVARYWPNVLEWAEGNSQECIFATNLLALPCDQRYGMNDMTKICELICK